MPDSEPTYVHQRPVWNVHSDIICNGPKQEKATVGWVQKLCYVYVYIKKYYKAVEIDNMLHATMWKDLTHITPSKEATLGKDSMPNDSIYMKIKNRKS